MSEILSPFGPTLTYRARGISGAPRAHLGS
jgi:hypothetical protein